MNHGNITYRTWLFACGAHTDLVHALAVAVQTRIDRSNRCTASLLRRIPTLLSPIKQAKGPRSYISWPYLYKHNLKNRHLL